MMWAQPKERNVGDVWLVTSNTQNVVNGKALAAMGKDADKTEAIRKHDEMKARHYD